MAEVPGKDQGKLNLVLSRSQKVTRLLSSHVIGINTRGPHRYFLKFETFLPHKDYPDVDVSQRGSSGPMKSE